MEFKFTSAVLFVKDIKASRDFYEGLLGQKVLADHGPNVGFEGGFAIWEAAHAGQIVHGKPVQTEGPLGRDNLEIYFENSEMEKAAALLKEAGVSFVHEMVEQPWGQRVLRVYDPDGHIVEVGEPMPAVVLRFHAQGLDADALSKRTSMPIEFVRIILEAGK